MEKGSQDRDVLPPNASESKAATGHNCACVVVRTNGRGEVGVFVGESGGVSDVLGLKV